MVKRWFAALALIFSRVVFVEGSSIANVADIRDFAAEVVQTIQAVNADHHGLPLVNPSTDFGAPRRAKILLFPPILFESHLFIFKTLGRGLQELGHQLTLYVSDRRVIEEDSRDFSVRRFPGIFSTEEAGTFLQGKVANILNGKPTLLELFDILGQYSKNCDVIFSEGRESIEQLKKDNYDFVIVDPNEMCGFMIAEKLGLPYIVFSTGMWVPYEAFVPSPISYVPEFNSQLSDRMTFIQRVKNTFIYGISRFGTWYLIFPMYNRLIAKYRVSSFRMDEMIQNSKSWLLCTDHALEFPRPVMPTVEYVGGILGRPARPLPQPLNDWADDSGQYGGFVVVSFGAGVKRLDLRLESIFVKVLSKLPYRVIWRYTTALEGLGSNIKLVDWLPQNDILAHPNVRAFLGHGGTNGVYECLFHGVPVVGMPLFGDHYDAMTRVHAKGIGIYINWKSVTEDSLMNAISQVIDNPKYRIAMQKYSKIHRDQPMTPLQRAVHRIDYTIRYKGADHLRPQVFNLSLFKYFLIDIQLSFLVLCLIVAWTVRWFFTRGVKKPLPCCCHPKSDGFLPLSTSASAFDHYHSPSTASVLRSSSSGGSNRFIGANGTSGWFCSVPVFLYKGIGNGLIQVCVVLRLLAVHIASHCGRFRTSSRLCMRCLDAVSTALRCVFPNGADRSGGGRGSEKTREELEFVIHHSSDEDEIPSSRLTEPIDNDETGRVGLQLPSGTLDNRGFRRFPPGALSSRQLSPSQSRSPSTNSASETGTENDMYHSPQFNS